MLDAHAIRNQLMLDAHAIRNQLRPCMPFFKVFPELRLEESPYSKRRPRTGTGRGRACERKYQALHVIVNCIH